MTSRRLLAIGFALALSGAVGCGQSVDLATDLQVTEVSTGWFDAGIDPATQWNHLVASISFRLKNVGTVPVGGVQMTVAYWADGADGESASKLVRGIGDSELAPGQETEPIVVRSDTGYNLEGARADLFDRAAFKDWTVKLFAKRGGRIVPIGEYKVERRLILDRAGSQQ